VEGRPAPRRGELPIAWYRVVSPGYFRALEIPLRAGRMLDAHDSREAPPVVLVNETMARRFWPGENPVDRRFSLSPPRPGRPQTFITVAGVVGDLHHRGLAEAPDAEVYFPYSQPPFAPGANVAVRTAADPARFASVLRALVRGQDRDLPVSQVRTLDRIVAESVATARLSVVVLALFAGIALLLAAAGIYGVISFAVTRRTREIGVRMALGAMPGRVLRAVVGQALGLAAGGIAIGGAGALALTRVLRTLLFGVSPTDPMVFAAVAVTLAAVAAVASWIPARRAAALDPLAALREE
jgi:putative ABC transport system permease protein